MAEGGGLLNRYTVNPVSWVRIPSPPPTLRKYDNYINAIVLYHLVVPILAAIFVTRLEANAGG